MLELKYFKELPCRLINKNTSFVQLAGADLYVDKDGNRYGFISIKNNYRKPLFSLYLYIKEYDSTGTFLKDTKYSFPTIYAETGVHVLNQPIPLENGCDGIEVFVYLAEYVGYNFYNDKFTRCGKEEISINFSSIKTQAKIADNASRSTVVTKQVEQTQEETVTPSLNSEEVSVIDSKSTVKKIKRLPNFLGLILGGVGIIFLLSIVRIIINFVIQLNG